MHFLGYIKWSPSPTLVDLGFISIQWYSVLFALGFFIGYWVMQGYFKKAGLDQDKLDSLLIYVVLATIIGARLGHCLFYDFEYFSQHPLEIFLPVRFEPKFEIIGYRGLASHGGAIGLLISLYLYSKRFKVSYLWLLDRICLLVPLAGCFIRLGNLMNSEIIGKPTDVPWAFIFELVDDKPRHPGQLYEAISYLIIFIIMQLMDRYGPKRQEGFYLGFFLSTVFVMRYLIEFVKENQSDFEAYLPINMGQILSIPFILIGLYFLFTKRKALSSTT